ncbi:unnamed protein product [Cylicocyclus nassatus]|uniref:SCP domain-containing protein n=1 Tax=Cylicocyclus nassatus TaxID=53992 RepID=A0AA36H009_CYLNA|nr:unnamed protein product [Cylicocyclus nassatus]
MVICRVCAIMPKRCSIILLVAILLPAVCNAATQCTNNAMESDNATAVLNLVNAAREKLAGGSQNNGKDKDPLPKAGDINKLEWDCDLEANLQVDIDAFDCKGNTFIPAVQVTTFYVYDNIYHGDYDGTNYGDTPVLTNLVKTYLDQIDSVGSEAFVVVDEQVVTSNDSNIFNAVEQYAELMRADATKLACSHKQCPSAADRPELYVYVCCTDKEAFKEGEYNVLYNIYQSTTSTPCPTAPTTPCPTYPTTPCPTYPPARAKREANIANEDVFRKKAKLPKAPPGDNTICSDNEGMTDPLRTLFLNLHNYRRAKLALGEVFGYGDKRLPPAKNMLKLNYACKLEASALQYAADCPSVRSTEFARPNQGENFLRLAKDGFPSFTDAVNMTVYNWWNVVNDTPGIDNTAKLKTRHLRSPITSFIQMAWATTRYLGCSVADCKSYYVTVCRYSPKGNIAGEIAYKPGHTCTECKSGTTCEEELGLSEVAEFFSRPDGKAHSDWWCMLNFNQNESSSLLNLLGQFKQPITIKLAKR